MSKKYAIVQSSLLPAGVFLCIGASLFLSRAAGLPNVGQAFMFVAILLGSVELVRDTAVSLRRGLFGVDYIAIFAIVLGVGTGQFLVAGVISFMFSMGRAIEKYGIARAKASLTALVDRIPNEVLLAKNNMPGAMMSIHTVLVGQEIMVRKGEVIPLDGILLSDAAYTDESSLTGEPYMMDKEKGDVMRSGTVNVGNSLVLRVTKTASESTYRKIIEMVRAAQNEKAPMVRLADQYSKMFTLLTIAISGIAYAWTQDAGRVLSVLVIATPCPLILATPIALLGGVNAAAKRRILVKNLASLETTSRITSIIFDKTGTVTIGKPRVTGIHSADGAYTEKRIYGILEAIECHSLHPIAKAIVQAARDARVRRQHATDVEERVGEGISGIVEGERYTVKKIKDAEEMSVELLKENVRIALIQFEDTIKEGAEAILSHLRSWGMKMHVFTGDKRINAEKMLGRLGLLARDISLKADCSPEEKEAGIKELKSHGEVTAMVGDGINDAPALALADVGMVFSNEEHTAASEAADIVFLDGDIGTVSECIGIGRRTVRIAKQSIIGGIGFSMIGMVLAAFGFIPPVWGAIIQEAIDVVVIFNALRASA